MNFDFHAEKELLDRKKPPMLVDGLLVQGSLIALVSKYGVGKSFLALDLALSIAAGRAIYLGSPLRQQGTVVYVLAEGAGRFGLRAKLWKQSYGVHRALPFFWLDGPVNLTDGKQVDAFIEDIQQLEPVLVVFDTLSRCLVGADENSQQAMSTAVDNADRIRKSVIGMTVLLLHHMNASGTRERGSTTIPGGLDSMLFLHPRTRRAGSRTIAEKGHISLTAEKQKDIDKIDPLHLEARILAVEGEWEENGEMSTSVLWLPEGAGEVSTDPKDIVVQLVTEHPGLTKNQLAAKVGGRKQAALKLIDAMVLEGRIRVEMVGQAQCIHLTTH